MVSCGEFEGCVAMIDTVVHGVSSHQYGLHLSEKQLRSMPSASYRSGNEKDTSARLVLAAAG